MTTQTRLSQLLDMKTLILDITKINITDLDKVQALAAQTEVVKDSATLTVLSETAGRIDWKATYPSYTGAVPNSHNVVLDAAGTLDEINGLTLYMTDDLTKVVVCRTAQPLFSSLPNPADYLRLTPLEGEKVQLEYYWADSGNYYVTTEVSKEMLDTNIVALVYRHHDLLLALTPETGLAHQIYKLGQDDA